MLLFFFFFFFLPQRSLCHQTGMQLLYCHFVHSGTSSSFSFLHPEENALPFETDLIDSCRKDTQCLLMMVELNPLLSVVWPQFNFH